MTLPVSGTAEIASALAAFQAEVPTVAKTHTATVRSEKGSYSYTYADLADVTEAAMPLLAKHGLAFTTTPRATERGMELVGLLLHVSGESLSASLPFSGGTYQQVGSALTYLRRYLLGCMTGVVTDDDDDGQTASDAGQQRPRPRPARQQQREAAESGEQVTAGQLRKIGAAMGELGMRNDREAALAYVARVVGRAVESRNDLTRREAGLVIDALDADVGRAREPFDHVPDGEEEQG